MFLKTTYPVNVSVYAHFGFIEVQSIKITTEKIPIWAFLKSNLN